VPTLLTGDPAVIEHELAEHGLRFERWPARTRLDPGADQSAILATYAEEIARIQQQSPPAS